MTNGIPPTSGGGIPPLHQTQTTAPLSGLPDTGVQHDRISTGSSGLPPEVRNMFDSGALDNTTLEGIQSLLDDLTR